MKILFVTTISGTVNAFLIPHIKMLLAQGNEVGAAFNSMQDKNSELIQLGIKIHDVPFQRNPLHKDNLKARRKIKEIILKEGYKLIHVHTPVASFVTRLACRRMSDVTMLYTAHGFHFYQGASRKNWLIFYTLEKMAARWTDGIITMNQEDFNAAAKLKLRRKNTVFNVHGVGLNLYKFTAQTSERKDKLRKQYHYSPQDFIIIYVGELSYRKHQDLLIETIHKLKGKIARVKLLLVGDGELSQPFKELAQKLSLENEIEFLGYRKDVDRLMAISDLAVSTSRQEGLPVNVMEAMATALPVVVTDCRGNRDLVSNGVNGLVIGINDAEQCANAIEKLYHNKELRNKFSAKNRELIREYSLENVLNEMDLIYSAFIENKEPYRVVN